MCKRFLQVAMVLMMASLIGVTGCKKTKSKSGADIAGISGRSIDGIDGIPLGERPDGLEDYENRGQFEPVYFGYDSSQVQASERVKLESVASFLRQNSGSGIIIEGHCDTRGSREYNLALGERRALAARAYLIGLGIDSSRLQTKSFGEEMPADLGENDAAHSLNRRAEFVSFQ